MRCNDEQEKIDNWIWGHLENDEQLENEEQVNPKFKNVSALF